mgnify:CR=1 FL=1
MYTKKEENHSFETLVLRLRNLDFATLKISPPEWKTHSLSRRDKSESNSVVFFSAQEV